MSPLIHKNGGREMCRKRYLFLIILISIYLLALKNLDVSMGAENVELSSEYTVDSNTLFLAHYNDKYNADYAKGLVSYLDKDSSALITSGGKGKYGEGLQVPGGSGYGVSYTRTDNFNLSEGTVEMWVKPFWNGDDSTIRRLFNVGNTDNGYLLSTNGEGNINRFRIEIFRNGKLESNISDIISSWLPNVWYHIAFTYKKDEVKLYINGISVGTPSTSATMPDSISDNDKIDVGHWSHSGGFYGIIDEVRISNKVRTAGEFSSYQPEKKSWAWIWYPEGNPLSDAPVGARFFRKAFNVKDGIEDASLRITADDFYTIFLNNEKIGERKELPWQVVGKYNFKKKLVKGSNLVAVNVLNTGGPAGLIFDLQIQYESGEKEAVLSDESWLSSRDEENGWKDIDFSDRHWAKTKVLGKSSCYPWGNMNVLSNIVEIGLTKIPFRTGNLSVDDYAGAIARNLSPPKPQDFQGTLNLYKKISISAIEDYLVWFALEPEEDKFQWKFFDNNYENLSKIGMKYVVYPWLHFVPTWYASSPEYVPYRCLEHNLPTNSPSIWAHSTLKIYDGFFKKLKEHFEDKINGIIVPFPADYGEAGYPVGFLMMGPKWFFGKEQSERTHFHRGFWCNDSYAQENFRNYVIGKYGNLPNLNREWQTNFRTKERIEFPENQDKKRYWLDFVEWYHHSLTNFVVQAVKVANRYFATTPMEIKIGHSEEALAYGKDITGLVKAGKENNFRIHSTHGSQSHRHYKRFSSACKFYNVPLITEPPAEVNREAELSRIFKDASNGTAEFFDYTPNLMQASDVFQKYQKFMRGEKSIVDVALFFPTTNHYLHPEMDDPPRLVVASEDIRDVFDYDIIDERLIIDGALENYRILIFFEGNVIEDKTLHKIKQWIEGGGVVVFYDFGVVETVEGDKRYYNEIFRPNSVNLKFGQEVRVQRIGKGWTVFYPYPWEKRDGYYEVLRGLVYHLSTLDLSKKDALAVDDEWDKVQATRFKNWVLYLNPTDKEVKKKIRLSKEREMVIVNLPPKSLTAISL